MKTPSSWLRLAVLAGLLSACFSETARAQFTFTTNTDGTLTLYRCGVTNGQVVIPASVDGRQVTRIDTVAFYLSNAGNTNPASLIIPEGVTEIGHDAFYVWVGLTNVVLPSTLKSIGNAAFMDCTSLQHVDLPVGLTNLGGSAFQETPLISVSLPPGLTQVAGFCFAGCRNLTNVVIPQGIPLIGDAAFQLCTSLTNLLIPDSIQYIGAHAFNIDGHLVMDRLPVNVTNFGQGAFECVPLKDVTIPVGMTNVPSTAFLWCSEITNVVIPEGVTRIESLAFGGCSGIVSMELPDTLEYIAPDAFWSAPIPPHLYIPYSVTNSTRQIPAIPPCTAPGALQANINYDAAHAGARWQVDGGALHESGEVLTNLTPGDHLVSFTDVAGWGDTPAPRTVSINPDAPAVVAATYPYAFSESGGQLSLKAYFGPDAGTLTIPRTIGGKPVVRIHRHLLPNYQNITGVVVPDTVIDLLPNAFDIRSLQSITVDVANPVYGCVDGVLTDQARTTLIRYPVGRTGSYDVPGMLSSIADEAFADGSLNQVSVGANIASLGTKAFRHCLNLQTVSLSDGLVSVGVQAFTECWQLRGIVIPDSVTDLGKETFYCSGVSNVVIGDGVPVLRSGLVSMCTNLQTFIIGNGVTNIESYAFSSDSTGLPKFSRLIIPATVRHLSAWSIWNCNHLTDLYFLGDAPAIDWSPIEWPWPTLHRLDGTVGWDAWPWWVSVFQPVVETPSVTLAPPAQTGEDSGGSDLKVSGNAALVVPTVELGLDDEPMTNIAVVGQQPGARSAPQAKTMLSLTAQVGNVDWALKWPKLPTPGYHRVFARGANPQLRIRGSLVNNLFFYSVPATLTVATNLSGVANGGAGKLNALRSPFGIATNGASLIITRDYTITAAAVGNSIFSNWMVLTNDVIQTISTNAKLTFTMQSNLTLVANFVTNGFTPLAGTYYGLFSNPTNGVTPTNAGFCKVTVTAPVRKPGVLSGQLTLAGETASFTGTSDLAGNVPFAVHFSFADVTGQLQLPLGSGGPITGTVTETNGLWTAALSANLAAKTAGAYAGSYTLVIPGADDASIEPGGDGFGTVKVAANGKLTLAGSLGDGTALAQMVPISSGGDWPFYAAANGGKGTNAGVVMGWLTLGADLNGTVDWVVPGTTGRTNYPQGFDRETFVLGSRFTPPPTGVPAISLPGQQGVVLVEGGDLPDQLVYNVTLTTKGAANVIKQPGLTLSVLKSTGKFTGSFTNVGSVGIPFSGVVLQDDNTGYGWFAGTNGTTGKLRLMAPGN